MGVTIHYRGTLADKNRLEEFKEELIDIAESMDWKYQVLDEDWSLPNTATFAHTAKGMSIEGHMPLKGVSVHPHKDSEWLSFDFDSDGRLMSVFNMVSRYEDGTKPDDCFVFIKTQFAPPEVHVAVVKLLRYLKKKYIPDLEVHDEGGYWETSDEDELRRRIGIINHAMDILERGLKNADRNSIKKPGEAGLVGLLESILKAGGMDVKAHVVKAKPKSKRNNSAKGKIKKGNERERKKPSRPRK